MSRIVNASPKEHGVPNLEAGKCERAPLIRLLVCGTPLFFFPQIDRFPPDLLIE